MKSSVYKVENEVEIFYDDELGALLIYWTDWSDHDSIMKSCKFQASYAQEQNIDTFILDNQNLKSDKVPIKTQIWLNNEFFPFLASTSVDRIITVNSTNALMVKTSTSMYVKSGTSKGLEMVETGSFEHALEILQERRENK